MPNSQSLANHLDSLLFSGVFSDLTLTCGGRKFEVHRVILYMQSEYFRKLLDGGFKVSIFIATSYTENYAPDLTKTKQEAGASTINLPDDDPSVLQVLIHYLYHFVLDTTCRPNTASPSTFLVHVYAIADKYNVKPLRRLILHRLDELCNPATDLDDFVAVLRVTDACTADGTLWDILLPKVRANITLLLRDEAFQELVMELPSLTLPLLGMLDHHVCMKVLGRRDKTLKK